MSRCMWALILLIIKLPEETLATTQPLVLCGLGARECSVHWQNVWAAGMGYVLSFLD